jgi:transcriptional regulator with XRE-family HTH domain
MTLREARRRASLTQDELASLCGDVDQPTISALENNRIARPSHFVVTRIVTVLRAAGLPDLTSDDIDEFRPAASEATR